MFNMISPINVANITSSTGLIINGPEASQLGYSVASAGDVNGDGIADIIIGAPEADSTAGAAYIIYGGSDLTSPIVASSITSSTGFVIYGSAASQLGCSVASAGDMNGDGVADVIVGANRAISGAGAVYVIYGGSKISSPIYATSITSSMGLIINGQPGSWLSSVAGAGDVNGDGIDDIIVGAWAAGTRSGAAYIIYGKSSLSSPIDVASITSSQGVIINGSEESQLGISVAAAGDFNGDGVSDILIGAWQAGDSGAGAAYVIYGGRNLPSPITASSITSNTGVVINGLTGSWLGTSVSAAGDFNKDGIDDIIVGAWAAAGKSPGAAYVIYGGRDIASPIMASSITSSTGVVINEPRVSGLGYSVAAAGDINGDGVNDIIVGTNSADTAYVIYGGRNLASPITVSSITSSTGVVINGLVGSGLGISVANAMDVNGDGIGDIIVGANQASSNSGGAYVIYGSFSQQSQQNYCMLSQVVKFVSIKSQNSIGSISLGFNEQWCNSKSLFIGDFNGDGKKDLLCSLVNGESYIMLSQGTSFLPMGSDPDGRIKIGANDKWCSKDVQELHIGDFNNDKKSDLLCRVNVHEADEGSNYVMLSIGSGFEPMTNTTDGAINIGRLGKFCFAGSRLVTGNFDGQGGDDLFCNNPTGGSIVNMLMLSNGTSFVSANANILGAVQMGQTDACQPVWCVESGSKIMTGDFNGDGKADLLCNANGVNKIMLSMLPQSGSCDFKPISTDGNGTIAMGQGTWPLWCDTSKSTLVTADVDGDALSDLVCNDNGVNQIMLCKKISNNNYRFDSFNINNPKDLGNTSMAGHDKWCSLQSILAGDINGDTLDDLWCNQGGNVLGLTLDNL